ncbi:TetR/AcrR family transcriptional regulator [Sphingomonas sp. DT-207]
MAGEADDMIELHGPTKRPYHHGDLKPLLVRTAAAMLERDGPEAVSLRAVARAAGVSPTAPYNHFVSKEDLLAILAAAGFDDLGVSQRRAADEAGSARDRIVALGLDYVAFAAAHPQRYRLMFGVALPDWHERPPVAQAKLASFIPIRTAIADHLCAMAEDNQVEVAAVAAWALVHGLAMLRIDGSFHYLAGGFASGTLERRAILQFMCGLDVNDR